jgi:hypothetical protein
MRWYSTASSAVRAAVECRDRIYVQGQAATPVALLEALACEAEQGHVRDVEVMHLHTQDAVS